MTKKRKKTRTKKSVKKETEKEVVNQSETTDLAEIDSTEQLIKKLIRLIDMKISSLIGPSHYHHDERRLLHHR